jgi:hypothetical protein
MNMRLASRLALAVVVLICVAGGAFAQTITGTIAGTVTDPTGQVIAQAAVTLINEGTAAQRTASTDVAGSFIFPAVLPGAYTVKVESKGFQTFQRTGNQLTANERLSLGTIQLAIGSLSETVTVTAEGANVQTASAEGSALLTTRQLDTLAQRGRDVVGMLNLLPGVETRDPVEAVGGTWSNVGTPAINGLASSSNTVTLDGAPATDLGSSGSHVIYANFDSAAEVKILLNNYQAEYGRAGGAMINIITKGGTTDYHGSVYWYKRHEMFNATNFFNNQSGRPKEKYRYVTEGLTLGGPVAIPRLFNASREKLFFFYQVERNPGWFPRPTSLAKYTMPTAEERLGNFSQSLDSAGKLIVVKDPLANGAAFAGNVIPTNRINKSGQALLKVFALPNQFNRDLTKGTYNYEWQESLELAKLQHVFRLDYRATDRDSLYFRGMIWGNSVYGWNGSGGFAAWPMALDSLEFLTRSGVVNYTRVMTPTMVNEFNATAKRVFLNHPLAPPDELAKIQRSKIGFTAGQWHPEVNPNDIIPQATFTGAISSSTDFGGYWGGRYPAHRIDSGYTLSDGLTVTRGGHTFKAGFYFERDVMISVPGWNQTWMGSFSFNRDTNNANDSGHPFGNAMLGNFTSYTEPTTRLRPQADNYNIDWYVQDSWRATRRLTLELGLRVAWGPPYRQLDGNTASWAWERYSRTKAPVLYQPVLVGGKRLALDPLNGQTAPAALIGAYVTGSGDPANGMVTSRDSNYPKAFFVVPKQLLQPRFGLAWDVFGNGKTAVRLGFGMFNQLIRNEPASNQPPIAYNPVLYYGSLDTFLSASGVLFPGNASGWDKYTKQPGNYNITLGIQQHIGLGTVVETKYVSTLGRHLTTSRNLNTLPNGARFLTQNLDPTTNKPYPDNFIRTYPGYGTLTYNDASSSSNYHALEVTANRRFVSGLDFGVGWTWSKWMDWGGPPMFVNYRTWNYGKNGTDQTHKLIITYTYNLPALSRVLASPVTRWVFDNWQVSGITMFASGMPSGVSFSTTDGTDQTGGGDGQRIIVTGKAQLPHGERTMLGWFDTTVFKRPGMNEIGNAPKDVIRGPGRNNWDVTLFKNFPVKSEQRVLQFRWEFYNVFNHTQFSSVNTSAQFDLTGKQVNGLFGTATAARSPRVMQVSLRFRF